MFKTTDSGWEAKGTLSVGAVPWCVFVGDANNDGLNDIVTADNNDSQITIYNGTSSGGWEAKYTLDTGSWVRSVFVGDANNDGYNDILSADASGDTVTIYNGTGGGGWEAQGTLDVGDQPWSVFVGDANNDGYNDILTANYNDNTVSIYNGTSSNDWEARGTLGVGTETRSVFVGDANNDGYNDILTANRASNTVTIYNGTSSNDWEAEGTLAVGTSPRSVFVGDANNDGYNDILAADYNDDTVTIYNGTGSGWETKGTLDVGNGPYSVFVGDANNDGLNDILTANELDTTVSIYKGTGSGWEAEGTLSVGTNPVSVFVGDANNDGYNDILTADSGANTVSIYNGTDSVWDYRKKIVIDSDQVAGNLENYPMLFTITDSDLKNKAQSDGDDIYFTSSDGKTRLNHEIESYDSSTGTLIAWVNITSLSSTTDTVIYMYYNNSAASDQSNPTGVWDINYKGVWHMSEDPGPGGTDDIKDSTSSANHGTAETSMTSDDLVDAQIGEGIDFDGLTDDDDYIGLKNTITLSVGTYEFWILSTELDHATNQENNFLCSNAYESRIYTDLQYFEIETDTSNEYFKFETQGLVENRLYHAVFVRNGDAVDLYIDGSWVEQVTTSGANTLTIGSVDSTAGIGGDDNAARIWPGIIDEVRVSNNLRNSSWVNTSYKNQFETGSFYKVYEEELIGYQWVELYNAGTNATNLSSWSLSDNDGNSFNLTGAGEIPAGGYLICHLGQTGPNSSTNVYDSPGGFLGDTDDLALMDNSNNIIDYVAWGGDVGTDDDLAVTRGEWTGGTYVDTSLLNDNETIGRDKDSNDTNTPADWEDGTNKADPYGVNATMVTQGAQNIDRVVIPEFNVLAIPIIFTLVLVLYINSYNNSKYNIKSTNDNKRRNNRIKKNR
jgi:hypothetical protein